MTPKVSVCVDVYNYGRFLPEAVRSVLAQAYDDLEVVISDDCSTDDSYEVAQHYAQQDSRVRVARNDHNLGMVRNRNACLRLARGEYVKWLHADDFLTSPDAVGRMAKALDDNAAVSLVACARQIVDEQGKPIDTWSSFEQRRPLAGVTVINRCLVEQRNLIGGPSAVMFRRSLASRGFDEQFFVMADMEMWFHLLEQGCFVYLQEPFCAFRTHGVQQTAKDRSSLAPALENAELLRRYLGQSYIRVRPWMRRYLEYDAVRRIVVRTRKIGAEPEHAQRAVQEFGGWKKYRRAAVKQRLHEAALKMRRLFERHLRLPPPAVAARPIGINVAGFAQSVYGVGETTRAMWRAVQATGLPCVLVNVRSRVHKNDDRSVTRFSSSNPYRVNLMTFSFDYARRFYRDAGRRFFAGRYNVGVWYVEQEHFPTRWLSAFDYYDEIWTVTEFARAAIAASSPVPVRKITFPFAWDDTLAKPDRQRFGFSEAAYVFLFNFDYFSTTQRKNPAGLIAAFRQAFGPDDDAVLVLKSINSAGDPTAHAALQQKASGANVVFMDDHLPHEEMVSLFASADCYVSLHRSEGLGFGMVQAMYLGKPVIATGYSGNLEFMNADNSLLVSYEMTEMKDTAGIYEPGIWWADPDVEHAATLMRWVYEHREEAQAIGQRAAVDIRKTMDPKKTAAEIRQRVQEIAEQPR